MIGVFDSGIGGLSVHHALVAKLPQADFVYLADQAHAPYGSRPSQEIVELTKAGCIRLFEQGASLIVLACNTAAAIALRSLQDEWLPAYRGKVKRPVNVLGLIVPTIEAATGLLWKERQTPKENSVEEVIGIFATPATVRSDVYAVEIHKRRPELTVFHEACGELARMIEAGASRDALAEVIALHVRALTLRIGEGKPFRAILGCTHYEIVADLFVKYLPAGMQLIHQPRATADALMRYLAQHPEYAPGHAGKRHFFTTGMQEQNVLTEEFWGGKLMFEKGE